jgi:hypothetical protein
MIDSVCVWEIRRCKLEREGIGMRLIWGVRAN